MKKAVTWIMMIPVKLLALPLRAANWLLELAMDYKQYTKDHRDR